MTFNRTSRENESIGDLLIAPALGHEHGHLALSPGEHDVAHLDVSAVLAGLEWKAPRVDVSREPDEMVERCGTTLAPEDVSAPRPDHGYSTPHPLVSYTAVKA